MSNRRSAITSPQARPREPELIVPEIVGQRCLLRAWVASDVRRSPLPAGILKPALTTVPDRFVAEDARAWIERQRDHARGRTTIVLAIVPKPIGTPGISAVDSCWSPPSVVIFPM